MLIIFNSFLLVHTCLVRCVVFKCVLGAIISSWSIKTTPWHFQIILEALVKVYNVPEISVGEIVYFSAASYVNDIEIMITEIGMSMISIVNESVGVVSQWFDRINKWTNFEVTKLWSLIRHKRWHLFANCKVCQRLYFDKLQYLKTNTGDVFSHCYDVHLYLDINKQKNKQIWFSIMFYN